ncbi:MAG: YggS family pyridoxal phosphate-dependent enzyme [Rubrobacteraceae bacterium]|uniref:YggS family pyridoxal phosphate-dependent enzyme n=1 Tax=Rubrobacter naiadicus TaxID=1392641 RepID=UPI00235E9CF7|nr:YggS family pyridoxal phosphate-dependent enzyme [Rubrobacter naiadicus]MCL6437391.1 YggS family pyridoxal phosphate-dependent enzyme [Rubrobacteraceae bacterium]
MRVSSRTIRENLEEVERNVARALERGGRTGEEVRVLVATKYFEPEQMSALAGAGARLVGENRLQDLVRKQEIFGETFEWHFIGHLQRRKAKEVVRRVSLIHSVDSVRLVEELAKRAPEGGGVPVLLQVNVSGEESKYGVPEGEVERLLEAAAATGGKVSVRGFMTMAPLVEDAEDVRYVFARLRAIRDRLRESWRGCFDLSELSMGMSNDYTVAVEEGATIVRIGRTLIREG